MARISEDRISEIIQNVDIVDVVSQYLSVEKKGKDYKAVCPFHDDTNPSMSISTSKQIYKCFVCGAGGNSFNFLQNYLNIPYIEAVKKVAEIGGLDVSDLQRVSHEVKVNEALVPYYRIHEEANRVYSHLLYTKNGQAAYDYLQSRHIDDDIIKQFCIGYAGSENQVTRTLNNLEFDDITMIKSGLVLENNNQLYDRYRDRVMFALHDINGRVIGFSGRIYKPHVQESKYINSPESDIFIKSKTLYNYHKAKDAIKKEGFVYLLEGFMDVIALSRININNTLALMGTSFSKEHIQLIKRLTNTVYICLDGDKAGVSAAIKTAKLLLEQRVDVKMIKLINEQDPDEILEVHGQETLELCLKNTISPIEFEINHMFDNSNMANHEQVREFIQLSCKLISTVNDPIDREYFIDIVASKSKLDHSVIREYLASNIVVQPKQVVKAVLKTSNSSAKLNRFQIAERHLLFYMFQSKQYAILYEKEIGFMFDDRNRVIASYIVDYYRQNETMQISRFIANINNTDFVPYVVDIIEDNLPLNISVDTINDYINTIKEHAYKIEKDELRKQFAREVSAERKIEIAEKIAAVENK